MVRHSNQCRSNFLALLVLLDPQQWTIVLVSIALWQVTKCVRSVMHDGVDVVAAFLVQGAPLLFIVAQAVILDEGDAIEMVLSGEFEVFTEPSLGFAGGKSSAHCATECVGVAFDVVAVEAHVLIACGGGQEVKVMEEPWSSLRSFRVCSCAMPNTSHLSLRHQRGVLTYRGRAVLC